MNILQHFKMGTMPAAFVSLTLALGCHQAQVQKSEATEKPAMAHTGNGHGEAMSHGEGHDMETLPVEKRVAFMSGHVEAGLALYRAGAPDQAAKHLLHPVSETHQAERKGIDALGFQAQTFEAVSKALDEGRPAAEIEPMLKAAEDNMALMQTKAGGEPKEILIFLMDTTLEEYAIGVKGGLVTDPGEYQDAYGFTVVALKMSKRLSSEEAQGVTAALDALLALWPKGGPLADSKPAPVNDVKLKVEAALAAIRALP